MASKLFLGQISIVGSESGGFEVGVSVEVKMVSVVLPASIVVSALSVLPSRDKDGDTTLPTTIAMQKDKNLQKPSFIFATCFYFSKTK